MTGPFVLIVLGILFLLANLHLMSRGRLALLFAHYWPVLLILWGVIKLIEYQHARQEGVPAPGIGAGGVILLIILIIGGLTASQVSQVNWGELKDEWGIGDEGMPCFGESSEYDEQASLTLPAGAAVKIVNERGAVNVNVSNNEKIEISAHKKICGDAHGDADKLNEQTKTQVNVSGNLVTINANTRGAGDRKVSVDLSVSIPRKAAVTIASERGDINLMGRDGNVEIANQRGDVNIEDVNGNLNLNTDRGSVSMGHSSVRVTQISGDVSVQGRSDEVTISDVKGSVRLSGDISDSLRLSKIGKSVSFKSSRTDLEFTKLNGDFDLDADTLRSDNLVGPLHVTTRSKDVTLDGVSGDARIQNENSSVQFGMRSAGNLQIDNRNGDIIVGLPEKIGFKVEARSTGGEVQADFPGLNVTNDDREGKASGTVGNGAIHLVLNSEHGDIRIRRGELQGAHSTPEPPETPPPPKLPKTSSKEPPSEPTEN
jgi:hypothetical protein